MRSRLVSKETGGAEAVWKMQKSILGQIAQMAKKIRQEARPELDSLIAGLQMRPPLPRLRRVPKARPEVLLVCPGSETQPEKLESGTEIAEQTGNLQAPVCFLRKPINNSSLVLKVKVFKTQAQKALGVHGEPKPLDVLGVYVFTNCGPGIVFTHGLTEPIRIYFFNSSLELVGLKLLQEALSKSTNNSDGIKLDQVYNFIVLPPNCQLNTPETTAVIVETSEMSPKHKNFNFLREALK